MDTAGMAIITVFLAGAVMAVLSVIDTSAIMEERDRQYYDRQQRLKERQKEIERSRTFVPYRWME